MIHNFIGGNHVTAARGTNTMNNNNNNNNVTNTLLDSATAHQIHNEDDSRMVVLPPDLISASTVCGDADSVSSLESCASGRERQRRSIFQDYWASPKKTRPKRAMVAPTKKPPKNNSWNNDDKRDDHEDANDDNIVEDASHNTYEKALEVQEGIKSATAASASPSKSTPPGVQRRRQIFSKCFNGETLGLKPSHGFRMNDRLSSLTRRMAFSDSSLVVKKLPSCLKPPRYARAVSASKLMTTTTGVPPRQLKRRSVSFAEETSTFRYEVPQEKWAMPGWSKYYV